MRNSIKNQKGSVLTAAVILATLVALMAAAVLSLGYNQTSQIEEVGIQRTSTFYKAQAGVVDANWRIRVNRTLAGWGGNFTDPNFNPPVYYIDLEATTAANMYKNARDANSDVEVDIGPMVNGLRAVDSKGLDT